jgi:mono/diheme cytochrome c family protein
MVLDSFLLLTGLYLLFRAPAAFSLTAVFKYLLVVAATGLAIMGSRKGRKSWNALAFLLLAYAYGMSLQRDFLLQSEEKRVLQVAGPPSLEAGIQLYQTLCQRCHGADGRSGYRKSPSLHPAQGDSTYWRAVIQNGKGVMPAHPYLTEPQIQSLVLLLSSWQSGSGDR